MAAKTKSGRVTRPKVQFICTHCPQVRYPKHDVWEDARLDWAQHNARNHSGYRENGYQVRNVTENGWQDIVGQIYVPINRESLQCLKLNDAARTVRK